MGVYLEQLGGLGDELRAMCFVVADGDPEVAQGLERVYFHRYESGRAIARDIGCPESTLRRSKDRLDRLVRAYLARTGRSPESLCASWRAS